MDTATQALQSAIATLDELITEEDNARPTRTNKLALLAPPDPEASQAIMSAVPTSQKKPGRKRGSSRRSLLLQDRRVRLVKALSAMQGTATAASAHADLPPFAPASPTGSITPEGNEQAAPEVILDSALAVLADVSLSEEALQQEGREWTEAAQRYYSTGLYALKEEDPSQDPVTLVCSKALAFGLWVFLPLLPHNYPTYAASLFDNATSAEEAFALQRHADLLGHLVLQHRYRSLEVVQSFLLQGQWLPPGEYWSEDRAWALVGHAARIATEIRLDLPYAESDLERYRPFTLSLSQAESILQADRRRTWLALSRTDLNMAIQTGRVASISGIQLASAGPVRSLPQIPCDDPFYNCSAAEALNRHTAKTLVLFARMSEVTASRSDYRDIFNGRWTMSFAEWFRDWPKLNTATLISHYHIKISLFSLSLRFPGPPQPVLQECQSAALSIVQLASSWSAVDICSATNFSVTSMAYGAALLLKVVAGFASFYRRISLTFHFNTHNSLAWVQAARLHLLIERSNDGPARVPSGQASEQPELQLTDDPLDALNMYLREAEKPAGELWSGESDFWTDTTWLDTLVAGE
ncbi:hypothetical protein JCM8547_003201 [Rhodosporidiobolus lusitaniae]